MKAWPSKQLRLDYDEPRSNLAQFCGEFDWAYYATWTFRRPRKDPLQLEQTIRAGLRRLPPMYQPATAIVGLEGHESGCLHAHALMTRAPMDGGWRWWKEWAFKQWGISRVYPYEPARGAVWYLSKYVLKRGVDGSWFVWQRGDS